MRLDSNMNTHYTDFVQASCPDIQINDSETKLIPARVKLFVTKGLIAYFDEVVVEEI
ncbi:MAG: hypothetical protein NTY74_11590 [Ignavibacteriae bacterium]|nr:hypothetical protein [Ignavibacteriota bacterium]